MEALTDKSQPEYQDKDDALHPYDAEDYYEWWYFDARFDNGYSCALTMHWRNGFLKPHIPTLQMYIYTPNGTRISGLGKVDSAQCTASEDRCDVKMGESFARVENDGTYRVRLQAKKIAVDLTYRRLLPPYKRGPDFFPKTKAEFEHGWVVPVPRGEVEGTLFIDGQAISAKGEGYHDHNWGNANMGDCFRGWAWGRMYDPKYTIIYAWILPIDEGEPPSPSIYLARGNEPVLATSESNFMSEKAEFDPETGRDIPRQVLLRADKQDLSLSVRLDLAEVVEKGMMQKVTGLPQYYFWRFLASYQADIKIKDSADRISGKTISEYMLLHIV